MKLKIKIKITSLLTIFAEHGIMTIKAHIP